MKNSQDYVPENFCYSPSPADVDLYEIADDGGLIYNPLTMQSIEMGTLEKYDDSEKCCETLELDGVNLEFCVPKNMTAYDVVPVNYKLTAENSDLPIHISVTAFEDETKRNSRDLYDLNLPGRIDVEYDYLGHVNGTLEPGLHPILSGDFNDIKGASYPSYQTTPLIRSGIVGVSDLTWFKFRYTNIGNTILDGDGNGTFMFEPYLYKKNEQGEYEKYSVPENLFYRIFDNIYPGESGELYITFRPYYPYPSTSRKHPPGDYKLEIQGVIRNEQDGPDFERVVWSGTPYTKSSIEFIIKEDNEYAPVSPMQKYDVKSPARNSWLHKYEEFMSSFDTIGKIESTKTGVIYFQPAPWSKIAVVKLIVGNEDKIRTVAMPICVESKSLHVDLNSFNNYYVLKEDGSRYPAIMSEMMADMRGNTQITPYCAENIINDLLDMKEAGINYITSIMSCSYDVSSDPTDTHCHDAFKFGADVLRVMNLPLEGMVNYPFGMDHGGIRNIIGAENIIGKSLGLKEEAGCGDAAYAHANSILAKYIFERHGDSYIQFGDGSVPFCSEDTRGWMRYDIHFRHHLGSISKEKFREFLAEKYENINLLNKAWGSNLKNFDEIDPELDGTVGEYGSSYEYVDKNRLFCDYNIPMADLDVFRTIERIENYIAVLEDIKDIVPESKISLRTEGGNWMAAGIDPCSNQANYRHVVFSARRCAMIQDILVKSGLLCAHSDYTTLPYSPKQVYDLTKNCNNNGIAAAHMPQFNRMRDIAINSKYGADSYQIHYNIKNPAKGAYINTLIALYPWFKATYEGGGIPGILWQDYLCDGYVTKTQFEEMKFFKQKLDETLSTPQGKKWATNFEKPNESFKQNSKAKWSYDERMVLDFVENTKRNRKSKFQTTFNV